MLPCRRGAAGPNGAVGPTVWIAATVSLSYARIMAGYREPCGSGARDRERRTDGTIRCARARACRDACSTAGTTHEALRFVAD